MTRATLRQGHPDTDDAQHTLPAEHRARAIHNVLRHVQRVGRVRLALTLPSAFADGDRIDHGGTARWIRRGGQWHDTYPNGAYLAMDDTAIRQWCAAQTDRPLCLRVPGRFFTPHHR